MTHFRERLNSPLISHSSSGYPKSWYDPIYEVYMRPSSGSSRRFKIYTTEHRAYKGESWTYESLFLSIKAADFHDAIEKLHTSKKIETYYQQRYAQEFAAFMAEG